ncbi:hypothetical protein [Stenotrophomonas sp. 24(2023)]|uniref:hypothetical protein n=1 Tax=Stenotrophomonas sp. 24(2023) TaxID=3068324 RepID=UPI0027DFA9C3|nr:hypothetical protein [Stenotrophomonas sp. 24(2023)]WMJ71044.1 hypothetical protein Q9R17_08130 [Stenotrophomonas sp. 24(2023)]
MSYDMMVFDATVAPREAVAFIAWFERQARWDEHHGYDDPALSAPALQAWFADIAQVFPPSEGPMADAGQSGAHVTDYSIGQHVIYGAFAFSVAEQAHGLVQDLAEKHGVGFFDVGAEEAAIVFPDGLVLIPD